RERFYIKLYSMTGRPRLVNLIARLRQEIARSLRWPTLQHAPEHHEAFFDAIRAGDAERAVSQLASHYRRVAILIRRYLRDAAMSEKQSQRTIRDIDVERAARSRRARNRGTDRNATG
ncbi:MAG: FCD domain-containing protein, partial [Chloroflexi bacterium]